MNRFSVIMFLAISVTVSGCDSNTGTSNITNSSKEVAQSTTTQNKTTPSPTPISTPTPEVKPKLGGNYKDFEVKFGKHTSKYMDAYGYKNQDVFINTSKDLVKEIKLSYSGDDFLLGKEKKL
ncbi:hypothetical protein LOZ80_34635 [Paenibacillus sp. HWE-109]|uniref:hypothetical protein n=1 Tax=Paenibacillus sp. HWE-109 TaxID=1306526 RepID=UPI001EDCC417|nr:hypothetical protein [Paenibacillus sp. HWE-109]UKS26596.1 hypothetical protein LOZ80_34635 [Paenibacillus sp. HWE-109]